MNIFFQVFVYVGLTVTVGLLWCILNGVEELLERAQQRELQQHRDASHE